jgi:branched-subunit amino acid aminotransferase/4-amino-4-deoxychorismate lyase
MEATLSFQALVSTYKTTRVIVYMATGQYLSRLQITALFAITLLRYGTMLKKYSTYNWQKKILKNPKHQQNLFPNIKLNFLFQLHFKTQANSYKQSMTIFRNKVVRNVEETV